MHDCSECEQQEECQTRWSQFQLYQSTQLKSVVWRGVNLKTKGRYYNLFLICQGVRDIVKSSKELKEQHLGD